MAHKILERSPLKNSFVWILLALDPSFAMCNKEAAAECMKSVLHKSIDVEWKEECECDKIMNQFRQLLVILDKDYKSECECFSVEEKRLDSFFFLIKTTALKDLWEVIQPLLTLPHGHAAVERGCSVNSSLLQPNLKSHSVVARRMMHDTVILSEQSIAKFQVTPELLRSCSLADVVCGRVNSATMKPFGVSVRLRQGYFLSPNLFLIYVDRIVKKSESSGGVKNGECTVQRLLFAHDLVLLDSTQNGL